MKLLTRFMAAMAALLLALPAQAASLEDARSAPKVVKGGAKAPLITGKWMQGTQGSLGVIPAQVAKKLKGRRFENFDAFRNAFWTAVNEVPDLKKQFNPTNKGQLENGKRKRSIRSRDATGWRSEAIRTAPQDSAPRCWRALQPR